MIRILLGLLKYNQGEVRLGDMELKEICLNNLYDRVSYLSQDAPVFDGTIKEIWYLRNKCQRNNARGIE